MNFDLDNSDTSSDEEAEEFEENEENFSRNKNESLDKKYPNHHEEIRNLPRYENPIFEKFPGTIVQSKNADLKLALHTSTDAEKQLN